MMSTLARVLVASSLVALGSAVDPVDLGPAGGYAILSKTGISTVPASAITGDIGVSPIAATAMTGFTLTLDSTTAFSTSTQVTGDCHAASYGGATATALTSAVSAMELAYTDAAGRANADDTRINLGTGLLGGDFGGAKKPLTPGVYTWGTAVSLKGDVYFDGGDHTDAVFILQIASDLVVDGGVSVVLAGNAKAENIFWQVAGFAEVGLSAHMEGILLVKTAVTFITGSTLEGRVLAQTHVALQVATITEPTTI